VVWVHVRPGKWTNTCRACRRGATGGVARRPNIGRRHAGRRNIGCWWGGTVECRQPVGGLARGGAGDDRAAREGGGGFATRKWGSRVLSPTERERPGLSGWIKALFRGKTRNRGRGWAELRRPDEKKGHPGASSGRRLELLLNRSHRGVMEAKWPTKTLISYSYFIYVWATICMFVCDLMNYLCKNRWTIYLCIVIIMKYNLI
jgi:hypothetical protein